MKRVGKLSEITRVLCLGAHCDDIEIGAGGTLLRLIAENPAIAVDWVVFSGAGARAAEARNSAEAFCHGAAEHGVIQHDFRDGFFPFDGDKVKAAFEELKKMPTPDLVLTHRGDDAHQDHRTLSQLAWNTFRDHLIWEYEIPKYDGDLGRPNVFVPITDAQADRKVNLLMRHFPTQAGKHWFTPETFRAMLRIRGIECASAMAEGFHCRKWTI